MNKKKKIIITLLSVILFVFILIQFIPVSQTNPPVEADLEAPSEVKAILKKACYDCHSHETVWPWYNKIAPVSWLVAKDVNEGRSELNFSLWGKLKAKKQAKMAEEIWEEVEEGEMPLKIYTLLHKEAILSDTEKKTLQQWSNSFPKNSKEKDEKD